MLLWSVIDPRGVWEVTSSWQFRNPEVNEPSDSAFAVQRFFAFVSLLVIVGGAFFFVSASHRNASDRATDDVSPHVCPNIYSSSDGEDSDGYAETTVTPSPVDPFPSASSTAVGSGEPVVLSSRFSRVRPVSRNRTPRSASASTPSITLGCPETIRVPSLRQASSTPRSPWGRSIPPKRPRQWWRIGTG